MKIETRLEELDRLIAIKRYQIGLISKDLDSLIEYEIEKHDILKRL